ncbi:hypothetical protein [Fuerstiella marisgermanici]|uniref:Uncharacterized protein n=1 Tax=Fuerstiella marisgermanici TaxID=1891926 RepID=A0A1P8WLM3_9PLAN|nr:hypothetical protein [Fuerstiella marisgermanici]APZ94955.1 hypothetical protein Fuma_04606 [Fuerstiella marisgermanici]
MRKTRPLLFLAIPVVAFLFVEWNGTAAQQPSAQKQLTAAKPAVPAAEEQQDGKKADNEAGDGALDRFMQQKLAASSRILEGLMTDDLKSVAVNADKLLEMSKEERWRASNDMMYLQHSTQFRNAVADLYNKADKRSIDGASLAWVNVTMSCIKCHEWVRNVVLADLEPQRK